MTEHRWKNLEHNPWRLDDIALFPEEKSKHEEDMSAKSAYLTGALHALQFAISQGADETLLIKAAPFFKKLDLMAK